jgi:hypothetical protein
MQLNKDILIDHNKIEFNPKGNSWVKDLVNKMFNTSPKEEKSGEGKKSSYIHINKKGKQT